MFDQPILTIIAACIGVLLVGICLAPWFLKGLLKIMEGPVGEFQEWQMTIPHSSQPFSPAEYWNTAIAEFEIQNSKLLREWNSHASTGDRVSREYRHDNTVILLELDRWNGFTISGEQIPTQAIANRIIAHLKRARSK
jgi:hypothetical protein